MRYVCAVCERPFDNEKECAKHEEAHKTEVSLKKFFASVSSGSLSIIIYKEIEKKGDIYIEPEQAAMI